MMIKINISFVIIVAEPSFIFPKGWVFLSKVHKMKRFSLLKRFISSSINENEVSKFSLMSKEWWDPNGVCKMLHQMNPARVKFIQNITPLKSLKVADIGCGGGLLSESLSRLGADVHGVDASESNIEIAKFHADINDLNIKYEYTTAEALASRNEKFDIVCALEIVEHIDDPKQFIENCFKLLNPGGHFFVSTINQNLTSYLLSIVFAENILRLVPPGTHDYSKFINPTDLESYLTSAGFSEIIINRMNYNPLFSKWYLEDYDQNSWTMNYIVSAFKEN